LAYELGKRALEENPKADGLYVGGGAWLVLPVMEFLEKEFDLPCISNQDCVLWDCLHQLDYWTPTKVSNRLLAGTYLSTPESNRHAPACPGHPWIARTSRAMTIIFC